MTNSKKIQVLFLCTHNQARSQMAEAILRHIGKGRYEVFSAGSDPATEIHPMAVKAVSEVEVDMTDQKPTHLDLYKDQSFDYVVTTCDRIKEVCPVFPGDPVLIHWSLPDPTATLGTEREKQAAFNSIAMDLQTRIRLFMELHRFK